MKPTTLLVRGSWVALAASFAACTVTPKDAELTESTSSALWTNGGFETSVVTMPPGAPWTVTTNINNGITVQNPQTLAGLNLQAGGVARTVTLRSNLGPPPLADPNLGVG